MAVRPAAAQLRRPSQPPAILLFSGGVSGMPDLPHLAIERRRVSRRSLLRGAVLMTGATALLAACTPSAPAQPPQSAMPAQPAESAARQAAPAPPASGQSTEESGQPVEGSGQAKSTAPAVPSVPTSTATRPDGAPRPGGTLIVAKTAEPPDLDPQLTSSLARQRLTMLTYNNLVKLSSDLVIQPDLAETWKVSADGKQIDFTLRQGVLWHPPVSRELTAADVKYSYERLLRESPGKLEFAIVDGVEVLDKYNVRFTLSAANAGILAMMADSRWGAIVNRETVERHGDLRKHAVGTGPFILEAWNVEQETRLKRNPDYFEKGKPHVENLVLRIVPDEAQIVAGLKSGAVHHAMLDDNRNVEQLTGQPGLQTYRTPRIGYDFLSFNQSIAPFNKIEVIQAINYAVDRDECIKAAAGGYAVQTAPCTPALKQWLLPEDRWKPYYKVDLDRSKALLARAGYPNGFEATVLTIPSIPSMFANAQVVQANLKRVGITLKVESLEYAPWIQRWQRKEFEATLNTTGGYADPDAAFYRAFHSKAQNWNNIANPELDRLLDEGRSVFEIEKRKPIYDKIQLQLLEQPGHLFLFNTETIDVAQKGVHGFSQHPTTTLWSYQNVWLDD
jgi:peptide/nickel transport system substrate-binding protein